MNMVTEQQPISQWPVKKKELARGGQALTNPISSWFQDGKRPSVLEKLDGSLSASKR